MHYLRRFLSHRWLLAVIGVALLFGFAMLHPFPRQSLFGPKVDGIPCCEWEYEIRRVAHLRPVHTSFFQRLLVKAGLAAPPERLDLTNAGLLPLYLALADDDEIAVRRLALTSLDRWLETDRSEVLAIYRKHLNDEDPRCQITSAYWVWKTSKDKDVKKIAVSLIDNSDCLVRQSVVAVLGEMAQDDPEVFKHLRLMAQDIVPEVRHDVVAYIRNCDERRFIVLKEAIKDPTLLVRRSVFQVAVLMKKDASPLVEELLEATNDADLDIRLDAAGALIQIDPVRFDFLKGKARVE